MSPVYFTVLLVVLIMGHLAETNPKSVLLKDRKIFLRPDTGAVIILSLTLILVSGLRYRVGTDYMAYYRNRVTNWQTVWYSLITFKEPGIKFLSLLSHTVVDDGESLIFLSALITVGLYCWTIYRYHAMYLISMLLYLFLGDWQGSFNGVRQYLAAAILFAGHRFILDRKLWQYCLVVILASLFHASAAVMILPYFMLSRKPDLTQLALMTVGAVAMRFSYDIIFRLIGAYKGTTMNLEGDAYLTNDVNIFRILVAFIPVAVYVFLCNKDGHTKEQDFYINAAFFNAFSMMAGMGSTYLARVGIYTSAAVSISIGYMFQLIDDQRTRKMVILFLMTIYFIYWFYSLQGPSLSGFQWIFQRE